MLPYPYINIWEEFQGTGHMGDWFSYEGYGPEVAAAGGSEREL